MVFGIILAGGKGTRINSKKINKVVLLFAGKPMIVFGVELFRGICNPIVLVVGSYAQSVKDTLKKYLFYVNGAAWQGKILYAHQKKRLGTGHALKIGLSELKKNMPGGTRLPRPTSHDEVVAGGPSVSSQANGGQASPHKLVLVGYGDHMMFYKKTIIKKLINFHKKQKAALSLISTIHTNSDKLAWGIILRDKKNNVSSIIEYKDATLSQRKIKELNAGFYCFDYDFLKNNIAKIKKSPLAKEYYLTDIVKIAVGQGEKVLALKVPFADVGIGVNKKEELDKSEKMFKKFKKHN